MGDATSVIYALFAMLMIVSISFQKRANRDLSAPGLARLLNGDVLAL